MIWSKTNWHNKWRYIGMNCNKIIVPCKNCIELKKYFKCFILLPTKNKSSQEQRYH